MIDLARARAETPGVNHCIHFNNCGAALMPRPVIQALQSHIELESTIGGYEAADASADKIEDAYNALARLINAHRDEIAIVENATRAWDMVFYAFDFKPGDRILTATAEYASNYIAYLQLKRKTGVSVDVVPDDEHGALDPAALEAMIDDRVKLISITHVPTNGGLVNPAREIGRIAKANSIPFLLDACQSVGQLPIDVDALNVDFLSATSRKYLRGPRGVGFLYVRQEWIEKLTPPFLDLHAADWIAPNRYEIRKDARRFENWESNIAGKIGLGVAVNYALNWGLESIHSRVTTLAEQIRTQLSEVPGITVLDRGKVRCGIVSFMHHHKTPQEIVIGLKAHQINVSASPAKYTLMDMHERDLDALVRAGVHYYNSEEEIKQFILALHEVLGQ